MHIKPADRIGHIKEYYFSKKLREIRNRQANGEQLYNLGIGSPDLDPHSSVLDALRVGLDSKSAHQYQSYQGVPELRKAFQKYYQNHFNVALDEAHEILPLIGSKEGIMHISMALLNPGDQVLVPNPGYSAYGACAHLSGAEIVQYTLSAANNWLPNFNELAQLDLKKIKIMWVNYPHMPSGAIATKKMFEELIAFGKLHQILICNDNPYAHILTENRLSILSIPGAKETACELNSLSKAFNMAGWRVGVLIGHQKLLEIVLRFKSNMDSGMYKPVQLAAAKALELPEEWFENQNKIYLKRQDLGMELLSMLGCKPGRPKSGMFIFTKVPLGYKNGEIFADYLLEEYGIFIPPGSIFGSAGDQYIRMSLCTPIEVFEKIIQLVKMKLSIHV